MANRIFSGHYAYSIDPKNRVTIPANYRETLGEHFTLSINSDLTALALYPKEEWDGFSEVLSRIPKSDTRGMAYVRFIQAYSFPDQELDRQGRLLLPAVLRERVGLTQKIYFVGAGSLLEIWDEAKFDAFITDTIPQMPDLSAYMSENYMKKGE